MGTHWGTVLGKFLYNQHIIRQSDIGKIRYAIEIILSEFTEILTIVIFSLINHQLIETVIFLLCFGLLRKFLDGYHAQSIIRCFLLTLSSYLATMLLYPYFSISFSILIIISIGLLNLNNSKLIIYTLIIILIQLMINQVIILPILNINALLFVITYTAYLMKGAKHEEAIL